METETAARSACCCSGSFAEASASHPTICLYAIVTISRSSGETPPKAICFYHLLSCLIMFSFILLVFLGVVVLRVLKDLVSIKPCTKLKQTTKSDINSNATWNNAPSLSKSLGSRRSAKAPKSLTRQKHPRLCLESKGSQEAVLFFFECVTAMQYANRSYGSYGCKVVRS